MQMIDWFKVCGCLFVNTHTYFCYSHTHWTHPNWIPAGFSVCDIQLEYDSQVHNVDGRSNITLHPLLKFKQIVMIIWITMIIIVFQMIKKVKEEIENFIIKIENHNIDDKLFKQSSSPIIDLKIDVEVWYSSGCR